MTLQQGSTLQGGKYIIKKVLGQGGFGITYLAEHNLLRKQVAIKEFFMKDYCNRKESTSHVSVGTDGSVDLVNRFRQKFLSEARKIAHLQHANIIRISDVFEENGTAYYVMDYCKGGSLADLLNDNPNGIREDLALKYIRQVASAIEYVHVQNINHLDIKPANILLDAQDNTILIDFGISKHYDAAGCQTSTTPVGISHGYAAIEQYRQGGVSQFSPATDIYSLGATLFKLITGQTPPDASAIGEDGLPSFSTSDNIRRAIVRAMQFRRLDRPQSVSEWLALLEDVCEKCNPQIWLSNDRTDDDSTMVIISDKREENTENNDNHSKDQEEIGKLAKRQVKIKINSWLTVNAIDLGLPSGLKWANMNVGASSVTEYGLYFAWGEITGCSKKKDAYMSGYSPSWIGERNKNYIKGNRKVDYDLLAKDYKWYNGKKYLKYTAKNIFTLDLEDDAASVNWGQNWRMPTFLELKELLENCYWVWTSNYKNSGIAGCIVYKVKSDYDKGGGVYHKSDSKRVYSISDTHIFLPAAGHHHSRYDFDEGKKCLYWTSSLGAVGSLDAYCLNFNEDGGFYSHHYRILGLPIRAVCH